MEAEFINIYIAKQKALIDELQQKVIVAETQSTLSEQKLSALTAELQKLKADKPSKGKNE